MRRLVLATVIVPSLLCATPPTAAEMCTVDPVPAATLLLPYFEVDFNDAGGVSTLVSIHNARPQAALAHITLWTDYSNPTVGFDVFLTGYDVVRMNLRDVFQPGNIPITADEQSDPDDSISPHGNHPSLDGSFQACEGFFPFFNNPVITGSLLTRVQNGHTGQDFNGQGCLGSTYGDGIARGYITIDHSRRCTIDFPNDPGYFGGLDPVASNENALWGDYSIIDPSNAFLFTDHLVHIEADASFDASSTPTGYTFYGRFTQAQGGNDHREPLGNVWGGRYLNGGVFTGGTDYLVWRDSTSSTTGFVDCAGRPDWYPLVESSVTCWSEQEDVVEICDPEGGSGCFPLETQRASVGEGPLALPYDFGWCSIRFDVPGDSFPGDVDFPAGGGDTQQAFLAVVSSASGQYQIGHTGMQLGHVCDVQLDGVVAEETHHD